MQRAQSSRFLTSASGRRSPPSAAHQQQQPAATTTTTLPRTQTTLLRRPQPHLNNQKHQNPQQSTLGAATTTATTDPTTFPLSAGATTTMMMMPRTESSGEFNQQNNNHNNVSAASFSPGSAKRARRISELDTAVHLLKDFFTTTQEYFNQTHEEKHQLLLNEIYEIAFIGVLTKKDPATRAQEESRKPKQFENFIRDKETQDALKLGENAIALLRGGDDNDEDTDSNSANRNGTSSMMLSQRQKHEALIQEFQQQVDFWKSVAQSTHKHNGMLLEAKKMLEGSALRSAQLQKENKVLNEQLQDLQKQLQKEMQNSTKISEERQSYIDQLGSVATQLQKSQKKVEIHERNAMTAKREKEKEANVVTEKEKQIQSLNSQFRQANAAVEMLTASLNTEREQHNHVKHLYDRIVNHRRNEGTQTELSGPWLASEEFLWEYTETKLRNMFDCFQNALFVACEDATTAKKDVDIYKVYTEQALNAVDEAKQIEINKDASWGEQVRQLKREAEAECRRADEQKKKTIEITQEGEKYKKQLQELQKIVDTKYDIEKKLRSGAAQHVDCQTEDSFNAKTGSRRALNTLSMSSQTDVGWYSTLSVEANHRISEEMRIEKMKKYFDEENNNNKNDDNNDDDKNTTSTTDKKTSKKNQQEHQHQLLTNSATASDNMLPQTILSGRKAKDQIAVSRETVRKILSGGLNSLSSQQLQRKELLNAIRALSESVTLSCGHIKDLESEIERIVGEHFAEKPSIDQSVAVMTDRRGNLIVDGGISLEELQLRNQKQNKNNKIDKGTTSTSKNTSPISSPTQKLDFGFGSNSNMPLSPIRQHHNHQHMNSSSSSTMKPEVVSIHFRTNNQHGNSNDTNNNSNSDNTNFSYHRDYNSSSSSTSRPNYNNKNRNDEQEQEQEGSAAAHATNLQKLLERGESLEQQPNFSLHNNSNTNSRSSSRAPGGVLSKIEAVQRQTQKILDETLSPLGLPRASSSPTSASRRKIAFQDDENIPSSTSTAGKNRKSSPTSSSSAKNIDTNKKADWSLASTSPNKPVQSAKLRKQYDEQSNIQRQKQLPSPDRFQKQNSGSPNSQNSSRSSSVVVTAHRSYDFEKDLQRRIYQEEMAADQSNVEVGTFHRIEDPERNPYAREFYEVARVAVADNNNNDEANSNNNTSGLVASANHSAFKHDDGSHRIVGGESTPLLFPYNQLQHPQYQPQHQHRESSDGSKQVIRNRTSPSTTSSSSTKQKQNVSTSHFSPSKFNFG